MEDKKDWETRSGTSIYKKLAEVMKRIPSIEKTGVNAYLGYKYVEEEGILKELRKVLPEVGLCAYNTDLEVTIGNGEATVKNLLVIVDVDNGEKVEIRSTGYAQDKKGDKAVYKAKTGATKYGYLKGFCLPTGDDPERDEEVSPPIQPSPKPPDTTQDLFKGTREILSLIIFELFGDEKLTESKRIGMATFFKDNHSEPFEKWCLKYEHEPETVGEALSIITIIDDEKVHPTHVRDWNNADIARVNAEVERRN